MKKLITILLLLGISVAFAGWDGWGDPTLFKKPITFDSTVTFNDSTFFRGAVIDSGTVKGLETWLIDLATATADTGLYIKHYGARTTSYGLVVDLDTSENTAANVTLIDLSGSNAVDGVSDYLVYRDASNYWRGDGELQTEGLRVPYAIVSSYVSTAKYASTGGTFWLNSNVSGDFLHDWTATNNGDYIIRDGNLGVANPDFFQIQDSAGTMKAQFSNVGDLTTIGKILPSGAGDSLTKFVKIGSHCAVVLNASDTMWLAADTTGF